MRRLTEWLDRHGERGIVLAAVLFGAALWVTHLIVQWVKT